MHDASLPIQSRAHFTPEALELGRDLAATIRGFYERGWSLGTGGNYSALLARSPRRTLMTPSGVDKGALRPDGFLLLDEAGRVQAGTGKPSAEAGIHHTIYQLRDAGAVLHTHSVWCTILSDHFFARGEVTVDGYEMQKGLEGVRSHDEPVALPILENSQDIPALCERVRELLNARPQVHGFLLRRHGLYTWGRNLFEARRHVEIIEFLLEVRARTLHIAAAPNAPFSSS